MVLKSIRSGRSALPRNRRAHNEAGKDARRKRRDQNPEYKRIRESNGHHRAQSLDEDDDQQHKCGHGRQQDVVGDRPHCSPLRSSRVRVRPSSKRPRGWKAFSRWCPRQSFSRTASSLSASSWLREATATSPRVFLIRLRATSCFRLSATREVGYSNL